MALSPAPGPDTAAALLAYAEQRAKDLITLAESFAAQGKQDPDPDHPLQQVHCIEHLAEQCTDLHEIGGLARWAGFEGDAKTIDALVEQTWARIIDLAQALRRARNRAVMVSPC